MFTNNKGDRTEAQNYLVLLTDGKSDNKKAINQAALCNSRNVRIASTVCLKFSSPTLPDSSIVKIMSTGKTVMHPAILFYKKLSNIFIYKLRNPTNS
jgi:hypothetical protein